MAEISFRRHRFPPVVIQHAIWLYLRFTLSYRDVEDLLGERGLDMSYETIRSWVLKFGPAIARRLRQRRPRPSNRWHLDEMVVRIAGERRFGHEDPFPRPGPNGRCRVGQETFAGVRGNGRDAPIPDLLALFPERGGSTHSGRSARMNRDWCNTFIRQVAVTAEGRANLLDVETGNEP